ncbi:hypothetical protein EsDP_00000449 [Epichloe bromicola]|uniref:DUF2382 domain-containing protein n=1 Tax=Epichloe bromicola TaxID=79588 RepID=A0ABQ0CEY2_9HYPO
MREEEGSWHPGSPSLLILIRNPGQGALFERDREVSFETDREAPLETDREVLFETDQEVLFGTDQEVLFGTDQEASFETDPEAPFEIGHEPLEQEVLVREAPSFQVPIATSRVDIHPDDGQEAAVIDSREESGLVKEQVRHEDESVHDRRP